MYATRTKGGQRGVTGAGLALVLLGFAAGAGRAATLYVDDDCPGPVFDGSPADPFCAIQDAVVAAAVGDTIRVMPGTYNECVDNLAATLGQLKGLDLEADAFLTGGDNTRTVIDGTGQCPAPFAAVNLAGSAASPSSLEGFTITGGAASGVYGKGQVAVTHNLVTGNVATFGGGIFVYSATCEYGSTTAAVRGNDVNGNEAAFDASEGAGGDGGGVYVFAGGDPAAASCIGGDAEVTVDGNTIRGNTARDGAGGGLVVFTNAAIAEQIRVAITQNLISENVVPPTAAYGYGGGGAYLTTFGYGEETIEFVNNTVDRNVSGSDGGGVAAYVDALNQARHEIAVEGNDFTGNVADGNGGGLDLVVWAAGINAGQSVRASATGNRLDGNVAFGDLGGGGGIRGTFLSLRSASPDMDFDVSGNDVTNNLVLVSGGGIALWSSADADPDQDGNTARAEAGIRVENNRVADNEATGGTAVGGGIFAYLEAFGDAGATIDVVLNTVVGNAADIGAGGIEMESFTDLDTTPTPAEGAVTLRIGSSIIVDNDGFGIGGPVPGQGGTLAFPGGTANFTRVIDYNDVTGNIGGDYETWVTPGLSDLQVDPLLDAQHVPLPCSPTIDAGDPALDPSPEPDPDGGRVNLGHTGGTALATRSLPDVNGDRLVDGFEILELATAFGALPGEPRFNALVDLDRNDLVDGDDLSLFAAQFAAGCP